jgi:ATP-dependent Clp protease adaptor protein ClpS
VTRKGRREKREDRPHFTFKLVGRCHDLAKSWRRADAATKPSQTAGSTADCETIFCATQPRKSRQAAGDAAGMIDTVTKPRTKTKVQTKTERPRLHKVILVNDDYTPREFVVTVLKAEFRMTEDQAHRVMITAHRRGVCVVAVFTKDVAETKATRATDAGRAKGYPLLFTTEPEE